ncbi:MAG TPA: family 10 glycosylhydrolase, partial [Rubrivivax sp.]|nr:family 10 glycosylhydrolase [Rubrivivax sp.]
DPLAWWVGQAQARGLELHVWINPFRARHSTAKSPLALPHLALRQTGVVRRYGNQLWMDPGEPAAAAHTLAVVADVVRRYDVDGVHIDDYFYPYPVKAGEADLPFPDDAAHARHRQGGGTLSRDDWRRANVDTMVQELHATVRRIKPWVRFGISPFGLGRPDRRPAGVTGFSQYDRLYADVERWLENGWLDYLAPQLYWPIDRAGQAFPVLLDYWVAQNRAGRHVWPGLFTSQVTRGEALGPRSWPAQEILEQIALQRAQQGAGGHIHFSMVALLQDRDGIATRLQQGPYATPALVPATPWLDDQPPPAPVLRLAGAQVEIQPAAGEAAARWAVWRRVGGTWHFAVLPAAQRAFALDGADAVVVSAVDRVGNVSARNFVQLP